MERVWMSHHHFGSTVSLSVFKNCSLPQDLTNTVYEVFDEYARRVPGIRIILREFKCEFTYSAIRWSSN